MILECLLCAFKNGVPIWTHHFYLLVVSSKPMNCVCITMSRASKAGKGNNKLLVCLFSPFQLCLQVRLWRITSDEALSSHVHSVAGLGVELRNDIYTLR